MLRHLRFAAATLLFATCLSAQVWTRDADFAPVFRYDSADLIYATFVPVGDGRQFAIGSFTHLADGAFAASGVGRLRSDGSVDSNFSVPLGPAERISAMMPLANDHALALRITSLPATTTAALVRLLADGRIDATYSPLAVDPSTTKLTKLADGRIQVTGFVALPRTSHLAYLTREGLPDPALVEPEFGATVASIVAALQSDGKVVCSVRLYHFRDNSWTIHLQRFDPTGRLDETFSAPTGVPLYEELAMQADGGILARAGGELVRYLPNGARDGSFKLQIPNLRAVERVATRSDGQIVLQAQLGATAGLSPSSVLLVSPSGELRRDVRDAVGAGNTLRLAAVEPDGALLVMHGPPVIGYGFGGVSAGGVPSAAESVSIAAPPLSPRVEPYRPVLARVTADGTKATVLSPGVMRRSPGSFHTMTVDAAGRVIVIGAFTHIDAQPRPGIARFSASGQLDRSFVPAPQDVREQGLHVASADGSLIMRQTVLGPRGADGLHPWTPRLVRIRADGTYDAGFAPAAEMLESATRWHAGLPDGRFLVSRFEPDATREENFRLLWLGANGQRIGTVNARVSGLTGSLSPVVTIAPTTQTTAIGSGTSVLASPVYSNPFRFVQPVADGRLLLGGSFERINGVPRPWLARLNADGSLDSTYQPDFGEAAQVSEVWLDRGDGRVMVTLRSTNSPTARIERRRLLPGGQRDPAYIDSPYWPDWVALSREDGLPDLNLSPAVVAPGAGPLGLSFSARRAGDGSAWVTARGYFPNEPAGFRETFARFTPGEVQGITATPWDSTIEAGGEAYFLVGLGTAEPAAYEWLFNGVPIPGETRPWLGLPGVRANQAGQYQARVTIGGTSFTSDSATLTVRGGATRLVAFSALATVRSDVEPEAGFMIARDGAPREWLLRALGPTLARFGVAAPLPDPELALFAGSVEIARDRGGATANRAASLAFNLRTFPAIPPSFGQPSRESALIPTLPPGAYTARMRSSSGQSGDAFFEIYDTASRGSSGAMGNGSIRGLTTPGNPLTAGMVIAGREPLRLLVRGVGPALARFGLSGVIAGPRLVVHQSGGAQVVAENDGWRNSQELRDAALRIGAFPFLEGSRDAALLLTLPPGAYTAQLTNAAGEAGLGMIEVYVLDN